MKIIKTLLVTLLVLTFFGCSSETADIKIKYETKDVNGEEFIIYNNCEFPSALGIPSIHLEELNNYSKDEAIVYINNYADCMMYIKNINFESSDEKINFVREALYGYYDDIGAINVIYLGGFVNMIYVMNDGKYYPIQLSQYEKGWLNLFDTDKYCFDSIDEMKESLKLKEGKNQTNQISSLVPENYIKGEGQVIEINGKVQKCYGRCGSLVYDYAGTQIPIGLGLPEYTNDEIREIIDENDINTIADKLDTLPDVINYIKRAGFTFDYNERRTFDDFLCVDVGNIFYYDDTIGYTISGLEMLKIKYGQCTATSTLFNYLLKDDYKEVGYVLTNHHAMIYILGDDDKYYLLDPTTYISSPIDKFDDNPIMNNQWVSLYTTSKACCDTLEELMDEFIASENKPQGPGETFDFLFTYVYEGINCRDFVHRDNMPSNSNNSIYKVLLPEGAIVTKWYGNVDYELVTPKHPTDQEYIIGIPSN